MWFASISASCNKYSFENLALLQIHSSCLVLNNLTPWIENSDTLYDKPKTKLWCMATRLKEVRNLITADEFSGKTVIDREGIQYGKIKHIHINQNTLEVTGITVSAGFHKDYDLSRDYIDRFTDESVLLSTPPIRCDIPVVDIDGKKIGKVKKLHREPDTNELLSIEVTEGLFGKRVFPKSEIWGIGEKVILRLTKDEYKE